MKPDWQTTVAVASTIIIIAIILLIAFYGYMSGAWQHDNIGYSAV